MKKILVVFIFIILFISCVTINNTEDKILSDSQYYADLGDYENAIKELDKDTTSNYKILFNKSVYLSHLKKYKESNKVINQLIRKDGLRLQYLKLKALNYYYLEDAQEFEKTLDKLYLLKPLDKKISDYYINYYTNEKKYEKAKKALWLLIDANIDKKKNFEKVINIERALDNSTLTSYSTFYSTL